jgi:O-antigen/teichoic acid export membrane protein
MRQQKSSLLSIFEPLLSGAGVRSIARNASYLLSGQYLVSSLRFVYAIILARYLGPELYGLFNYGLSWYLAFLPLSGLGLGVILSREVGRDRIQGAQIVGQTLTIRILLAIAVAAVGYLIGWFSEENPEIKKLLLIFSTALTFFFNDTATTEIYTAYEVNKYSFRQNAIFRPLEVVFGTVALACGGGLIAVVAIHTISWWCQAMSGLELASRHIVTIRLELAWRGFKGILLQGFPIAIGVFMVSWLQQGPLILFRHTSDMGNNLGQLALALQAFVILSVVPMAAVTASFPVLSRAVTQKGEKVSLFTEVMLKGSFIFGAAAGLAGMGAGRWLVNIIFGARYAEAGHLLGLTMWLLIPWSCGSAIWSIFLARSQFFFPIVCASAGAFVLTVSMPWFVRALGTTGAVIAAGVALMVWATGLIIMLITSDEINLSHSLLRPMVAVLVALVVFFALKEVNIWISLCASWLVLCGGTFLFGVLTQEERSALLRFMRISN